MPQYPWKRFWCPREGQIYFDSDGFPSDPESGTGKYRQKDYQSFDQMADKRCLVLLGEPGIGKSSAIADCKSHCEQTGQTFLFRNLRAYDSGQLLIEDLFQDPAFVTWRGSTDRLTLLLDSLDECLIRIGTVVSLLGDQFLRQDCARLRLRITCRTAVWPESFSATLAKIWGKEGVGVYEMTPLCQRNVRDAAVSEGLDPEAFIAEIERIRAQPWAVKPLTLRFLFDVFRRTGTLSATESELYRAGCRELCADSQERLDAGIRPSTDLDERYAIASRIAAVTLFCNRNAIWTAAGDANAPGTDVPVAELLDGHELAHGRAFPVTRRSVEETLDTGMFTARGPHRMGWAHQTYAEFLATEYLTAHPVDIDRRVALLTEHESGRQRVVPQLQQVAARLATRDCVLFDRLVHLDPEVLLRSDVATADDTRREHLVTALLTSVRTRQVRLWDIRNTDRLQHLTHPQLAEQLRPIISSRTSDSHELYLALLLAEACCARGLDAELLQVALNHADSEARCLAISSLTLTADVATRSRLLGLTSLSVAADPDDRVAGYAFRALWPECISSEELFRRLRPKQNPNHIGMYDIFLDQVLPKTLQPADLPAALGWVPQVSSGESFSCEARLQANIIRLGWENMDEPGVLEPLSRAIFWILTSSHGRLADSMRDGGPLFASDARRRQRIISAVLPMLSDKEEEFFLRYGPDPLVTAADFIWLLDCVEHEPDSVRARRSAKVAWWTYNIADISHTEHLLACVDRSPVIRETFASVINPVDLDSEIAEKARAAFRQVHALKPQEKEPTPLAPTPKRRVEMWLQRCENGEPQYWWCMARELSLKPDSRHYEYFDQPDITGFPGWLEADEQTRARILNSAAQYITSCDDGIMSWLGVNVVHLPALAGYQALRLLWLQNRPFVLNLDAATWARWLTALLAYPFNIGIEEIKDYATPLLLQGRAKAPEGFAASLDVVLHDEALRGSPNVLRRLTELLDSELWGFLRNMAWGGGLPEDAAVSVIGYLAEQGDDQSVDRCLDLLNEPRLAGVGTDDDLASKSICAIADHVDSQRWSRLWSIMEARPNLAERIIIHWAHALNRASVPAGLSDSQIADLYIWLEHHFPHADDPRPRGVHNVGDREMISMWRSQSVLNALKVRGTPEACREMARVRDSLPHLPWLSDALEDAVNLMRATQWQPLAPSDLLRAIQEPAVVAIQSGQDLLNAVVDSLRGFEAELHNELPAVRDLWDHVGPDLWRPLSENEASDRITRYLRHDLLERGVVVGREVQIRPGEETDIHVDAIRESGGVRDVITCIIETKGCWHRELMTAMNNQLVKRYLSRNRCQLGVYLVLWFVCDAWDKRDSRKKATPRIGIEAVSTQLEAQAHELSTGGVSVRSFVMDARIHLGRAGRSG